MSLATGETLGPYRIFELIGEGGMGVVYRAERDTRTGPPVALKVIRAALVGEDARARFQREASVRVEHPNIVRVLDVGLSSRTPYIAFELLSGCSLSAELARHGPLTRDRTLELGLQVARGLAAAHDAGIVHRDLKPSNLFVCDDGQVKIIDFGIALTDDVGTRITQSGQVVGTVAYMSPEQVDRTRPVDHRTDLWSLATVMYECLAGRPPFAEDSPLGTLVAVMMGSPPPLSSLVNDVDARLEEVIATGLQKRPEHRFENARAMEAALVAATAAPARVAVPHTLRPDEQRIVVLLYARGVQDPPAVEGAILDEGGTPVALPDGRMLGFFGADGDSGAEVTRAVAVAVAIRHLVEGVSVSAGRATRNAQHANPITGTAMEEAELALGSELAGVGLNSAAASELHALDDLLRSTGSSAIELALHPSLLQRLRLDAAPTPLSGRELELAQLSQEVGRSLDDRLPQWITIVGAPGVGKSRLVHELQCALAADRRDARVFSTRLDQVTAGRELSLWMSLLRSAADSLGGDVAAQSAGLAAVAFDVTDERHEGLASSLSLLLQAQEALPRANGDVSTGPTEMRLVDDRVRMAIMDWVLGSAERGPLVLTLDDAHRADARSFEVLTDLVERAHGLPLAIVLAGRPDIEDKSPELGQSIHGVRVDLRGLRQDAALALARACAQRPLSDSILEPLIHRSEGNPFFIEQFVRAMVDRRPDAASQHAAGQHAAGQHAAGQHAAGQHATGHRPVAHSANVAGEDRQADEALPPASTARSQLPIPVSVETAVQARLDALVARERELCKLASVFNRPFSLVDLEALGAAQPAALAGCLRQRGLWAARGRHQLDFVSGLLRDVAYRLLVAQRRQELHALAAQHLLGARSRDAEEVAIHWEAAGRVDDAASMFADAAVESSLRGDAVTTLRASDAAYRLAPMLANRFDVRMARAEALRFRGSREAQREELERASSVAQGPEERARVLSELCMTRGRSGDTSGAIAAGEEAVRAAQQAGDPIEELFAVGRLFLTRVAQGDLLRARRLFERVAALCEAHPVALGTPRLQAHQAEWRAHLAAAEGDISERERAFALAAKLHRASGDLRRVAGSETNRADVLNRIGAYPQAEAALRDAIDACVRVGHRIMEGYARLNLAYALIHLHRLLDAREELRAARSIADRIAEARLRILTEVYLAKAHLSAGNVAEAGVVASRASRDAKERGFASLEVGALTELARATLDSAPEQALDASHRATEILASIGGVEEDEVLVYLTRARALAAVGDASSARVALRAGAERLEGLARAIGAPEQRQSFRTSVPAHRELIALLNA